MHIETFKTFCDLIETGSFSKAAALNFISQSAVSQQLKSLEKRFDQQLLERNQRKGVTPTETGKLLYAECKEIIERFAALEERILKEHGVAVNTVMEFDNIETIKRSVEVGIGLSILPESAVAGEVRGGLLVALDFTEGVFTRPIGIIHRKGKALSAAAREFVRLLTAAPIGR